MVATLASSGSPAMYSTARATSLDVHPRFGPDAAVGLRARRSAIALGHVGGGVADVDLPAGDVVGPPVQRRAFVSPVIACLVAV